MKAEECAVIEIDTALLDDFWLVPDEDAVEQVRRSGSVSQGEMIQRTKDIKANLSSYAGGPGWTESLKALGNCAHLGLIPPDVITRVAFFRATENLEWACSALDPSISIMNKMIKGHEYQFLNALLFGDEARFPIPGGEAAWHSAIKLKIPAFRSVYDIQFDRSKVTLISGIGVDSERCISA